MYGIILAGGSGSRLWPLSRELYPKQLLKINTDKSLLEMTYLRLLDFMDEKNILSITNAKHFGDVKTQLSSIAKDPVLLSEPTQKNTAPAISVSVKYLLDRGKDDIVLVVPSDHIIKNNKKFTEAVEKAKKLAEEGSIVTFGIKPTSPETGYGYIKSSKKAGEFGLKVDEFKEKPDAKTAAKYFKSKDYFWNAGIFMFKASVFMETLKKFAPEIYEITQEFNFTKDSTIEFTKFDKRPSISIDYAVMEKAKNIVNVPVDCGWNDLGSWDAIYEINEKDKDGNVKIGTTMTEGCKNSFFFSSNRLVTGVGLDDIILVETSDAILACKKDKTQDVKKVFDKLKEIKDETHLVHTTVYRPWGYYTVLNQGDGYLTKMICVSSHGQLSLQSHNFRSEHWVVLSGCARVTLDNKNYILKPGSSIDIPVKVKHSLGNPYKEELKIIEVQKGDKLVEEDIIRYKDIYGRVKA